jgi:hypothetical protein
VTDEHGLARAFGALDRTDPDLIGDQSHASDSRCLS